MYYLCIFFSGPVLFYIPILDRKRINSVMYLACFSRIWSSLHKDPIFHIPLVFVSYHGETTISFWYKKSNSSRWWPAIPHLCQSTTCQPSHAFFMNELRSNASLLLVGRNWPFSTHTRNLMVWFSQSCCYRSSWNSTYSPSPQRRTSLSFSIEPLIGETAQCVA